MSMISKLWRIGYIGLDSPIPAMPPANSNAGQESSFADGSGEDVEEEDR